MKHKRTQVISALTYIADSYPEPGLYRNVDENDIVNWVLIPDEVGWLPMSLGTGASDKFFEGLGEDIEEPKKTEGGSVSESTLLRVVAIASGFVEYKDI